MSRALLLGAGNSRQLKMELGNTPAVTETITLDMDATSEPDILWDMEKKPWPVADNSFDQVHAYEVLEHLGRQGDWKGFFDDFAEIYRILKPGGYLVFSCPKPESPWAWGDPGHTRIISLESIVFLDQSHYVKHLGTTPMTDYRSYWKGDFRYATHQVLSHSNFVALLAVK